jgi:CBS domain-containing protein
MGTGGQPKVEDLMTRSVITVLPSTDFQELVTIMAKHRVSGVPVVDEGGRLVGIVSEADLLRDGSEDRRRTRALDWLLHPGRAQEAQEREHDAASIMTSPVVTVGPETSLWESIRTLRDAGVKRLPVVDASGRLVGIVSRADLLSAFVRTDEQIAEQVRSIIHKVLATDLRDVTIEVKDGRVSLRGSIDHVAQREIILELVDDIPGVLTIQDDLETGPEGGRDIPYFPIQPPGESAGPRVEI